MQNLHYCYPKLVESFSSTSFCLRPKNWSGYMKLRRTGIICSVNIWGSDNDNFIFELDNTKMKNDPLITLWDRSYHSKAIKWLMAANGLGTSDKIFKDLSVSKEVSVRISTGVRHESFEAQHCAPVFIFEDLNTFLHPVFSKINSTDLMTKLIQSYLPACNIL